MLASYSTGPLKNGFWHLAKAREEDRDKISINRRVNTQLVRQTRAEGSAGGKATRTPEAQRKRNRCPPERDREVSQQRHPTAG